MGSLQAWLAASVPIIGLTVNVVSQVLACRFAGGKLLRSIVLGFGAGGLVVVLWGLWASTTADPGLLLANLLCYGALGYGYFHFVNLGETARRVRILRELVEADEGLTLREILARYDAARMVEARLGRLLSKGQITLIDGRYRLGRRTMLGMVFILQALKRLVFGRSMGEGVPE